MQAAADSRDGVGNGDGDGDGGDDDDKPGIRMVPVSLVIQPAVGATDDAHDDDQRATRIQIHQSLSRFKNE